MNVRPASAADAEQVAAICNAVAHDLHGDADASAEEVRSWFEVPGLVAVVAERDGGEAVGYLDLRENDGRVPVDVRVAPAARGTGVAAGLLAYAESWARDNAPAGARLTAFVSERDEELRESLLAAGYELVRHEFTMEIELPADPEPPVFPDGVTMRPHAGGRDDELVYETAMEAFADHWDFRRTPFDAWRAFVLRAGRTSELWWIAEEDGEPVGVALNGWHVSGDRQFGWIDTLGVRRPWRRRGLGRALLLHSFRDFHARGATRVGLVVDAENTTGAVRLYEGVGMRAVRRIDSYWKLLP